MQGCTFVPGGANGTNLANEVPGLLAQLKLHGQAQQQQILAIYQEARQWLDSHDKEQLATATSADDAAAVAQTIGEDGPEPAVQGALALLARLAFQMTGSAADKLSGNAGLPLSTVASAVGTNLFDLFREWPVVCGKLAPLLERRGTNAKQLEGLGNICEWQKTLVSVALLSKKYKDLFHKYVHCQPEHKALVLKLGWTLYILLKTKLLPKFPDLVICMELLVCVMNVLVAHVSQLPADISPGPDGAINILDAISDALKADRSHVQQLMLSVNPLFTQQLQNQCSGWLNGKATHPGAPRVLVGCTYLPGLLEDADRMAASTASLEREYLVHFQKHGEIDEREMLFMDLSRFASPRMTPGSVYKQGGGWCGTPGGSPHVGMGAAGGLIGKSQQQLLGQAGQRLGPGSFVSPATSAPPLPTHAGGNLPFGLQSPMPIMQLGPSVATPITEALGSTAWLRNVTAGLRAEPSAGLLKYFGACVPNPAATIAKRVREMTEAVIPSDQQQTTGGFPLVQPAIAANRRDEAVKLYYHVLEVVLASEERVAASANRSQPPPCYTTLLTSSKLHKGLMACSLELVMACYKMASCPFPRVLEVINLHSFDLIKIVQTYVRHMPGMPLELKRHLYLMEERTVETLAWQAGSSLYPLIITAQGNTGATSSCSAMQTHTEPSVSTATKEHPHTAGTGAVPVASSPDSALMSDASDGQAMVILQPVQHAAGVKEVEGAGNVPLVVAGPAAPSPSKRAAGSGHSMMSPLKRARGSDSSAITTQPAPQLSEPLPAAVGRPPTPAALAALHPEAAAALTWLHDFLRKVLKLAWFRLGFLCQSLSFGPQEPAHVRQKVYEVVEHAVYMHTNLLYNRHLDQMLLSALYGYCKVQHLGQITFKEIISQYRRQPQSSQAVFRSVVLAQTNPGLHVLSRGDIIAYYNQAFVPLMKQYLLKGDAAGLPVPGLPPMPPPAGHSRQAASPRLGPGAASPRLFSAGNQGHSNAPSPGSSPVIGRPPLPPDSCAVQAVLKQTISGFFPAMPRGSNAPGSNHTSPKPPQFGQPAGKGVGGGAVGNQPAPAWPSGFAASGGGVVGQPFGPPPAKPQAQAPPSLPQRTEREMPSGIATLLRALDSADGINTTHEKPPAPTDKDTQPVSAQRSFLPPPAVNVNITAACGLMAGGSHAYSSACTHGEEAAYPSPVGIVITARAQGEQALGQAGAQNSPDAISSVSSAGHSISRGLQGV